MDAQATVTKIQHLLLNPKAGWTEIAAEPVNVPQLYKEWIGPLAAIPPAAYFIGMSILGSGYFHIPILNGVVQMVVTYALSLASVYLFALIIDYLAPQFGAEKNFNQAFKVAAYSPVAYWIAGVFNIIPELGILSLLGGLYTLYLLFVGLPILMKPAEDKATVYTLACIGAGIVISLVIGILVSRLFMPHIAVNAP